MNIFYQILKRQITDNITKESQITNMIFKMKKEMEDVDINDLDDFLTNNVKERGITKIILKMNEENINHKYLVELFLLSPFMLLTRIKYKNGYTFIDTYYSNFYTFMKHIRRVEQNHLLIDDFINDFNKNTKEWNIN